MSAESGMSSSLATSMSRALRSLCIQPEMARLSWSRWFAMAIWFGSVYTISFRRQPAFEDFCGLVDEAGAVGEFVEEEAGEAAGVEAMARRGGLEFGGQVVDFHAWRMPGRGGEDNGACAIWVQCR